MEASEIIERITPIFRDILEDDDLVLTKELTANDVESWDSLSHVRLIVTIEQDLGIRFDLSEASSAKNVGDLLEQVKELL